MKKFEVGKVYSYKRGSGIGYDECRYYDYYLITRKTEKASGIREFQLQSNYMANL